MDCHCNVNNESICPSCGQYLSADSGEMSNPWENEVLNPYKDCKILAELSVFEFSNEIKIEISEFYVKATNGRTRRKAPRRATIYWSIVHVLKKRGMVINEPQLRKKLDIKVSDINKAAKTIQSHISITDLDTNIEDVLKKYISIFDMRHEIVKELMEIHDRCRRILVEFNSCKMETLASGIVYFYLSRNLEKFDPEVYFESIPVSKDTVIKIYDSICGVYK